MTCKQLIDFETQEFYNQVKGYASLRNKSTHEFVRDCIKEVINNQKGEV